jgi:glycosyltransferase involved in cell wall biosynthesis
VYTSSSISKDKPSILFICTWFPNRIDPKNGNFIARHARIASKIAKIFIINIQEDYSLNFWQIEKSKISTPHYEGIHIYYGASKRWLKILIKPIQIIRAYYTAIQYAYNSFDKFHLIHAHVGYHAAFPARVLSKLKKIKYIVSEHSSVYTPSKSTQRSVLFWKALRWANAEASVILPVSKSLARHMRQKNIHQPYEIVPNSVDTKLFKLASHIESTNEMFTFLHVSNFHPRAKNVSGIIKAASILKSRGEKFHLIIAGDGDFSSIQKELSHRDLRNNYVTLIGPLSEPEVASLMAQSDCFLLFSNYENLPCVLIEAQACGLPIIATDVGGVKEIVEDESYGILIPPNDISNLVSAMRRLIQNHGNYDPQHIRSHALKKFSVDRIEEQLKLIYLELIC